jgi:hypothetical protein
LLVHLVADLCLLLQGEMQRNLLYGTIG